MTKLLIIAICTLGGERPLALVRRLAREAEVFPDTSLLVVENGAEGALKERVIGLADYVLEPALGLSRARNAAIRAAATATYLLFLDDDVQLTEGYVRQVRWVLSEFAPDILGGPVDPVFEAPPPRWLAPSRIARMKTPLSGWAPAGSVSGGNFAVRRAVFDQIGGFRSDLGMVGGKLGFLEEYEFVLRYRRWPGRAIPGIYYSHEIRVGHAAPPAKLEFAYLAKREWQSHRQKGALFVSLAQGRRRLGFRIATTASFLHAFAKELVFLPLRILREGWGRAASETIFASIGRAGLMFGSFTRADGERGVNPTIARRATFGDLSSLATKIADLAAIDVAQINRPPDARAALRLALDSPWLKVEVKRPRKLLEFAGLISERQGLDDAPCPENQACYEERLATSKMKAVMDSDLNREIISYIQNVGKSRPLLSRAERDAATALVEHLGFDSHHDHQKNWDTFKCISHIVAETEERSPILDAGSGSKAVVLRWLYKLGYRELYACDLTPANTKAIEAMGANFAQQDLTGTTYRDSFFQAVTSISVIEHNVPLKKFLTEMRRILKPNGLLCISTDYWSDPIDCSGIFPYGVEAGEMKIFNRETIREFMDFALDAGFEPVSPVEYDTEERAVRWDRVDRDYTFFFVALRNRKN